MNNITPDTTINNAQTNTVTISGVVIAKPKFAHNANNHTFYRFDLSIKRLSGTTDIIPVIIDKKLLRLTENDENQIDAGTYLKIHGQFRSYSKHNMITGKHTLILNVLAKNMTIISENECKYENKIRLTGYLCKKPNYRTTPLGKSINDMLIAVNRTYGKNSDYIPTICWGNTAIRNENTPIGTKLKLTGRIQSREYVKTNPETNEVTTHTAYEVSAAHIISAEKDEHACV